MIGSILMLFLLNVLDRGKIRSNQFRPIMKLLYWLLISIMLILGKLGAKPVEDPYIELGQIATVAYILWYVLIYLSSTFENKVTGLSNPSDLQETQETKSIENNRTSIRLNRSFLFSLMSLLGLDKWVENTRIALIEKLEEEQGALIEYYNWDIYVADRAFHEEWRLKNYKTYEISDETWDRLEAAEEVVEALNIGISQGIEDIDNDVHVTPILRMGLYDLWNWIRGRPVGVHRQARLRIDYPDDGLPDGFVFAGAYEINRTDGSVVSSREYNREERRHPIQFNMDIMPGPSAISSGESLSGLNEEGVDLYPDLDTGGLQYLPNLSKPETIAMGLYRILRNSSPSQLINDLLDYVIGIL